MSVVGGRRHSLTAGDVAELTALGTRLGHGAATVQEVSAELILWLEQRDFRNKDQWTSAMKTFKESVYDSWQPAAATRP